MAIVGLGCALIGFIIALIFGIQLLILAFRTSILWGLGYVFVPFVSLIFIALHWEQTKTPFLRGLLSIPFFIGAAVLTPTGR